VKILDIKFHEDLSRDSRIFAIGRTGKEDIVKRIFILQFFFGDRAEK
jgi:hypothetical protein